MYQLKGRAKDTISRLKAQDGDVPQSLLLCPCVHFPPRSLLLLPVFVSAGLVHLSALLFGVFVIRCHIIQVEAVHLSFPWDRLSVLHLTLPVLSSLPAVIFPCFPPPLLWIPLFFPAKPLPAFYLLRFLTPWPLRPLPSLPVSVFGVFAVTRATAVRGWGGGRGRGGFPALPSHERQRGTWAVVQTVEWAGTVQMWRGTSFSWAVTASEGEVRRIILPRDVGHRIGHFYVICPAVHIHTLLLLLLLLRVFGRKSWRFRVYSSSFLNLDVIWQLVCKRLVDLLGVAEVDHLLLPGYQDTNRWELTDRTPGCLPELSPAVNFVGQMWGYLFSPAQVFVSLHVGLVHLHRIQLHTTYLAHQAGCWQQKSRWKREESLTPVSSGGLLVALGYLVWCGLRLPSATPACSGSSDVCVHCSAGGPCGGYWRRRRTGNSTCSGPWCRPLCWETMWTRVGPAAPRCPPGLICWPYLRPVKFLSASLEPQPHTMVKCDFTTVFMS